MAELLTASPRRTGIHVSAKTDDRRNTVSCHGSPIHVVVSVNITAKQDAQTSKTDDRQRLAKERREERERSLAVREQQILQKEKRAQLLYEKQMEERWKKLEEQRQREKQRRAAVEEKRRQKLEEEKERHEAMMRRTLERNQQLEQRQKRWSWGGAASAGSGTRDGELENAPSSPVGLTLNTSPPSEPVAFDAADFITVADRLSASDANLPKQMESPASKVLLSSSATTPHPPERAHRCVYHSPSENVISRLLTATHSSLARRRNIAVLSGCSTYHSVSGSPLKTNSKPTLSPSGDKQNTAATATSPGETKDVLVSELQQTEKVKKEKRQPSPGSVSSVTSTLRRSQSPASMSKRSSSPAMKASSKIRTRSPNSGKEFPPSPTSSSKSSPMRRRPSSNNIAESRKKSKEKGDLARQKSEEAAGGDTKSPELTESEIPSVTTPVKEHERKKAALGEETSSSKTMAGTTNAEEAAKLLAERRRHARLQKELEEKERLEQEEAERKLKEELQRKEAEERARREEEARRLEEERRQQELEHQRKAEEERLLKEQQERELLARLEQQREEAETKAREEAERLRHEREQVIQQIEQERKKRKERIEEIMKRTRRGDAGEIKKEETKAEVEPTMNGEKELPIPIPSCVEQVEVSKASVSLESQEEEEEEEEAEEEAHHAVALTEAVPELEAVTGAEQVDNVDEQPNSVDESTDELQSMDVSPMSKDDGISMPEFSPLNEVSHGVELEKDQNGLSDAQAVEDLIDLTVHSTYTKLSRDQISLDDCNKNLIEGRCISVEENPLITSLTKSVEETHIQTSAVIKLLEIGKRL
ncbi:MAP7 domain-containing protein 2-like isoform X2 [Heterodontus francisci]|uniref:MAP7 domain-containing protein 2-like isoform X2 n=1 Tax=Heterodontus francisci TaxID=7792 RepID=UPI00355C05FA